MLQVRLELTTSASPAHILLYKYRALTDCATGACFPLALGTHSTEPRATGAPAPQDKQSGNAPHCCGPSSPHPPQPRLAWQRHFHLSRKRVCDPSSGPARISISQGFRDARFRSPERRLRRKGGRTPVPPRLDSKKGTISVEDKSYLTEGLRHCAPPGWSVMLPTRSGPREAEPALYSPSGFPSPRCASGGTIHLAVQHLRAVPPGSPKSFPSLLANLIPSHTASRLVRHLLWENNQSGNGSLKCRVLQRSRWCPPPQLPPCSSTSFDLLSRFIAGSLPLQPSRVEANPICPHSIFIFCLGHLIIKANVVC